MVCLTEKEFRLKQKVNILTFKHKRLC